VELNEHAELQRRQPDRGVRFGSRGMGDLEEAPAEIDRRVARVERRAAHGNVPHD
jgi:hypothetical protein